jgi:hypothetical protein
MLGSKGMISTVYPSPEAERACLSPLTYRVAKSRRVKG